MGGIGASLAKNHKESFEEAAAKRAIVDLTYGSPIAHMIAETLVPMAAQVNLGKPGFGLFSKSGALGAALQTPAGQQLESLRNDWHELGKAIKKGDVTGGSFAVLDAAGRFVPGAPPPALLRSVRGMYMVGSDEYGTYKPAKNLGDAASYAVYGPKHKMTPLNYAGEFSEYLMGADQ
jgi:hypothetical protein